MRSRDDMLHGDARSWGRVTSAEPCGDFGASSHAMALATSTSDLHPIVIACLPPMPSSLNTYQCCFQQKPAVARNQPPNIGEGNIDSIWKERPFSYQLSPSKGTALCSYEYTLYLMCVFDHNAIALHLYYFFMSCTSSIVER